MATHSSILAWEIPWTEEPGGLQSLRSQGVRCDSAHVHAHPPLCHQLSLHNSDQMCVLSLLWILFFQF